MYICTVNWFCVHLCCKHTDMNITLIDITSKRNLQVTDITIEKNRPYTKNQFSVQVFIEPVYSTCNVQGWSILIYVTHLHALTLSNASLRSFKLGYSLKPKPKSFEIRIKCPFHQVHSDCCGQFWCRQAVRVQMEAGGLHPSDP